MRITRVKGMDIRKVYKDQNNVYAVIGRVDDLVKRNIIFKDNTESNEEKWLSIEDSGNKVIEFTTLEEAKSYYHSL